MSTETFNLITLGLVLCLFLVTAIVTLAYYKIKEIIEDRKTKKNKNKNDKH